MDEPTRGFAANELLCKIEDNDIRLFNDRYACSYGRPCSSSPIHASTGERLNQQLTITQGLFLSLIFIAFTLLCLSNA